MADLIDDLLERAVAEELCALLLGLLLRGADLVRLVNIRLLLAGGRRALDRHGLGSRGRLGRLVVVVGDILVVLEMLCLL